MLEGLFQPSHLIVILIVILIVFGPGKLPEVGTALGKGIREFKQGLSGDSAPSERQTAASTEPPREPAGSPPSLPPPSSP
ncbi:MAG: hypothetical protein KatS3mg061_0948 [Dehalococcoidia bacterium]|nr:MAG: hypothetical protein KatS3mg061_0948 [Dehalococcoidia bacterium]